MKILQVAHVFKPLWESGGVARVAYEISKCLKAQGHELTVYTTNRSVYEVNLETNRALHLEGMSVYYFENLRKYFPWKNPPPPPVPYHMPFIAMKEVKQFDIIHIHGYRDLLTMIIYHYAKKYGIPYVLQAHSSLHHMTKPHLKWIYDTLFGYRLLRDASKVVALSLVEADQYRGMGVPEGKIEVIPNGIDLSEYVNLPPKGFFKKFNVPEDKKVILYLGRINKNKGIDFLIRAYACLINDMKYNHSILVIAGADDGYLCEIMQLANQLKIADKVVFPGMLSEKEKISAYVGSSVVVNVEPRNAFGLVPLEAAACLTPAVVSKGNAISETIYEGKFGFSVKYGNINELAESMYKMLNNDELLRAMGQNGRKFVFKNCNWNDSVTKLEKVYFEILSHDDHKR